MLLFNLIMPVYAAFIDLSRIFARPIVRIGGKLQAFGALHPSFVCHVGKNMFDFIRSGLMQAVCNCPLYGAMNKYSINLLVSKVLAVTKPGTCDVVDVSFLKKELLTGQTLFRRKQ